MESGYQDPLLTYKNTRYQHSEKQSACSWENLGSPNVFLQMKTNRSLIYIKAVLSWYIFECRSVKATLSKIILFKYIYYLSCISLCSVFFFLVLFFSHKEISQIMQGL
ncbi:hypothetical protein AQUCO_05900022v1 [Aquilegia coerulea]|uniref:Uncharacterized protein n=1 Tax=Aquilegia coerulea TaxID=218851 RepID=A0A2G5CE12_AQUCA|nr:hypothetical protein AQUCO_05900022v1 [Aquilegia coerulea]